MTYTTQGPKRRRKTRRDGNEGVRSGLGCTNRSVRMDWFKAGMAGNLGVNASPTANKVARQAPAA